MSDKNKYLTDERLKFISTVYSAEYSGEAMQMAKELLELRGTTERFGHYLTEAEKGNDYYARAVRKMRKDAERGREANALQNKVGKLEGAWRELLEQAKEESAFAQYLKSKDPKVREVVGKSIVWNTIIVIATAALAREEQSMSDATATIKFAIMHVMTKTCYLTGLRADTPAVEELVDDIVKELFDRHLVWAVREHLEAVEGALSHEEEVKNG